MFNGDAIDVAFVATVEFGEKCRLGHEASSVGVGCGDCRLGGFVYGNDIQHANRSAELTAFLHGWLAPFPEDEVEIASFDLVQDRPFDKHQFMLAHNQHRPAVDAQT